MHSSGNLGPLHAIGDLVAFRQIGERIVESVVVGVVGDAVEGKSSSLRNRERTSCNRRRQIRGPVRSPIRRPLVASRTIPGFLDGDGSDPRTAFARTRSIAPKVPDVLAQRRRRRVELVCWRCRSRRHTRRGQSHAATTTDCGHDSYAMPLNLWTVRPRALRQQGRQLEGAAIPDTGADRRKATRKIYKMESKIRRQMSSGYRPRRHEAHALAGAPPRCGEASGLSICADRPRAELQPISYIRETRGAIGWQRTHPPSGSRQVPSRSKSRP